MLGYDEMTRRNTGYIAGDLQERIRNTRLLVAGCGLGSVVAELALRTGFEHLVLVDGDKVEAHNLNRQMYTAADVGQPKVEALARRLRAIHPDAKIETCIAWVNESNAEELVSRADIVLDTIDFLDLAGILALHDAARHQEKAVLSGFAAAWSAAVWAFLPGSPSLRDIFGMPAEGSLQGLSYTEQFRICYERLAPKLPQETVAVMSSVIEKMMDGKPCPAPQLAVGTSSTAALMLTLTVRILGNLPVSPAPELILVDLAKASNALSATAVA